MPKSYFPPTTLKSAIPIAKTIYEKAAGKPMFRVTIADELGLKSEGRLFREMITAAGQYGLTSGGYKSERIALEEIGMEVAKNNVDAIFDALFAPDLFSNFYDHFAGGGSGSVPSEKVIKDYLKNTQGIPDKYIGSIYASLIENAKDWFLIQDIAGGEKIVPIDLSKTRFAQEMGITQITPQVTHSPVSIKAAEDGTLSVEVQPERKTVEVSPSPKLQLNIEIHISPETPEEKIESIFKNMRKYLWPNGQ